MHLSKKPGPLDTFLYELCSKAILAINSEFEISARLYKYFKETKTLVKTCKPFNTAMLRGIFHLDCFLWNHFSLESTRNNISRKLFIEWGKSGFTTRHSANKGVNKYFFIIVFIHDI